MQRTITFSNQKGGVGKTVTCLNLGVSLAVQGKKVALIDSDPQGSLTINLGHTNPDKLPITLSDHLRNTIEESDAVVSDGIIHHTEGIDFVPANIELAGLEVSLFSVMNREKILKQYIDQIKTSYDYILIDCLCAKAHKQSNAE